VATERPNGEPAAQPPDPGGVLGVLARVCRDATERLSAAGSGISMLTEGGARGVSTASTGWIHHVEDLQFLFGEGPCVDAFARGRPVLIADLSLAAIRWPVYVPAARAAGIQAVFAFPLQVGAACFGVLDVFRARTGPLTSAEITAAFLVVDDAVEVVLDYLDGSAGRDGTGGALADIGDRAQVYQAQGMVMVQLGISLADALVRMRAHAYAEGLRLDDVAGSIVNRTLAFEPDTR